MKTLRWWGVRVTVTCAALLVILLGAATSRAQTFRGTILGTVTDTSGASVVGATVTVHNTETGVDRITQTTTDGGYLMPELPVGVYNVTVGMKGFQKAAVTGVSVSVAAERRVDVALKPGEVTQQVTVSGDTVPVAETQTDTLGGPFEGHEVEEVPINGRD